MTKTQMSNGDNAKMAWTAEWRRDVERYVFAKHASQHVDPDGLRWWESPEYQQVLSPLPWDNGRTLRRDPSQAIGIPCPHCGHRPALRHEGAWACGSSRACDSAPFTLADVLRYLWKPKS